MDGLKTGHTGAQLRRHSGWVTPITPKAKSWWERGNG